MGIKQRIGAFGEDVAAQYLEGLGFCVLDRNWRCDDGEIDIIALDGDTVVVCEVKTRSGFDFGSALDAVTEEKTRRLRRLAVRWLAETHRKGPLRIDVVGVHRYSDKPLRVEHLKGAC